MQPFLPITVPVKKVKGVARQCYVDGDGIARCEQPLSPENTSWAVLFRGRMARRSNSEVSSLRLILHNCPLFVLCQV